MKGKALRKHSLHEKTAASVLFKLFISSNAWCHTTDAPKPWAELHFQMYITYMYTPCTLKCIVLQIFHLLPLLLNPIVRVIRIITNTKNRPFTSCADQNMRFLLLPSLDNYTIGQNSPNTRSLWSWLASTFQTETRHPVSVRYTRGWEVHWYINTCT